jgi:folate-dependent phosphoribosylglycinamide formyltransferase PurN
MRVLLVTSAVTFVPNNYDDFVTAMAKDPRIVGLLVIENKNFHILSQGLLLLLTGAAPLFGLTLLGNFFGFSRRRRERAFAIEGKKTWTTENINAEETLQFLRSLDLDLILNARTRSIFKTPLLTTPRFGCWNIHHGLLPWQRGVMCDFWSHLENLETGFSVHQMTKKIDDGPVLVAQPVLSDKKNYLAYLQAASRQEAKTCAELLEKFAQDPEALPLLPPPSAGAPIPHRKNPRLRDFYRLQLKGIRL